MGLGDSGLLMATVGSSEACMMVSHGLARLRKTKHLIVLES